jgi:hypothetical protein
VDWSGSGLREVAGCHEHGMGEVAGCHEHGNETAGSKRCGEFLDCGII